jgi:hypothetical protein
MDLNLKHGKMTKTGRIILWSFAILALLVFLFIESEEKEDFFIFLSGANDLGKHENIFEKTYLDWYHYFYSVLFALLLKPFLFLPFQVSKFIWLCLNAFFAYRIFGIIRNLLPLHDFTQKERWIIKAGGFLFAFRFLYENLHYSQITIFILFLALQGLQLIFSHKPVWGALLIALGINIKLLPIVLIPYLFYRRFFLAGSLCVVFYIGMLYLPAMFIGWDYNQALLKTWAGLINPFNSNHILDTEERSFHGLSTLLSTLLVKNVHDPYALPLPRHIADLSLEQLKIILNFLRLILIGFSLYFFRTLPFKKSYGLKHQFWEVSYLLLLVPLIFPHQQHYAFLFICPAFIFCLYYFMRNRENLPALKRNFLMVLGALIFIVSSLKLTLGVFNEYYEHFKLLTYSALLLIVLMAMCVPKETRIT